MAILFQHSNVALPLALERRLCRVFMTPQLHGIHHSVIAGETDSNWGTILSLPDWLHGTALPDVAQEAVEIGAPGMPPETRLDFRSLLRMPFHGVTAVKGVEGARGGRTPELAA